MTAGDLAVTLAAVLCAVGFAALVVVLLRVVDSLGVLEREMVALRAETGPLLEELRRSTAEARSTVEAARDDLERFDRVLGSAEAITEAVEGSGRVVRTALSAPVIKVAGVATGTRRAWRRLRGTDRRIQVLPAVDERRRA
ncbi:MAG: hypothetical protein ACO225_14590 [Ilumatobacteraceae bacterium]